MNEYIKAGSPLEQRVAVWKTQALMVSAGEDETNPFAFELLEGERSELRLPNELKEFLVSPSALQPELFASEQASLRI